MRQFQARYGEEILNPWNLAIDDPTGFVFLTTSYVINQLYCERNPDNDFDLGHIYDETPLSGGRRPPAPPTAGAAAGGLATTSVATTTPSAAASGEPNFLQAAALGLVNFVIDHPGLGSAILLILAILVLLYLIWQLVTGRDDDENDEGGGGSKTNGDAAGEEVLAGDAAAVEGETLVEEVDNLPPLASLEEDEEERKEVEDW